MMCICAIANQKGGVGKTTTCQNLGVVLARQHGLNVLLFDLDAQGNLTDACGVEPERQAVTTYQILDGACPLEEGLIQLENNLHLLPANLSLAVAELAFAGRMGRENLLRKALATQEGCFDVVLIDCPPSLGLLTINALAAAQFLLIPVQVEYHALAGLAQMQQTVDKVKENLNPSLDILGLVLTFFDSRKKLNQDVAAALAEGWGEKIFQTRIRDNVSLAEAPSAGMDIHTYKQACFGAHDYAALSTEFLTRIQEVRA